MVGAVGPGRAGRGAFRFQVYAPGGLVPDPVIPAAPDPVVDGLHTVARAAATVALVLGVGVAFVLALVWPEGTGTGPARRLLGWAWVALVATTLVTIATFGAYTARVPLAEVLDPALLGATSVAEVGAGLLARLFVLVPVTVGLVQLVTRAPAETGAGRWARAGTVLAAAGALAATWSFSRPHDPAALGVLTVGADVALLLAVGVAVGGPVVLWLVLRGASTPRRARRWRGSGGSCRCPAGCSAPPRQRSPAAGRRPCSAVWLRWSPGPGSPRSGRCGGRPAATATTAATTPPSRPSGRSPRRASPPSSCDEPRHSKEALLAPVHANRPSGWSPPRRSAGRRPALAAFAGAGAQLRPLARRVHFLAGLLVAPFVLVLCLTGLVYVFSPQIHDDLYSRQLYVDQVGPAPRPVAEQVAAALAAHPEAALQSVRPPPAPDRTTRVNLAVPGADRPGQARTVFVDPYTNYINGEVTTVDAGFRRTSGCVSCTPICGSANRAGSTRRRRPAGFP
ncbi:hypothetical protein BJF78_32035 [Pseudonocardia sp. CNS-139]|nr:hypothetical protein BJF78_32035 [Pseudonocardia sp. CNS-139]